MIFLGGYYDAEEDDVVEIGEWGGGTKVRGGGMGVVEWGVGD